MILDRGRARRSQRSDPGLGRLIRLRAGLTQGEMANLLGVDRSAIARWELGTRTPRTDILIRYRDLLDRLAAESARA